MKKELKVMYECWKNTKSSVFYNAIDAMCGFFVLVLLPLISLSYALDGGDILFKSYGFPFVTITFAAIYDSSGRLLNEYKRVDVADAEKRFAATRKIVLYTRIFMSVISLLTALLVCNASGLISYKFIPFIPLTVSGTLVSIQAYKRIRNGLFVAFGG